MITARSCGEGDVLDAKGREALRQKNANLVYRIRLPHQPTPPPPSNSIQQPTKRQRDDDSASTAAGALYAPTKPPPKKARITQVAIKELHQYVSDRSWPRNKMLPKRNVDVGLDAVIKKHGIERSQATRQLRRWKGITYEFTQFKMTVDPEAIYNGISDTMENFITKILGDLHVACWARSSGVYRCNKLLSS